MDVLEARLALARAPGLHVDQLLDPGCLLEPQRLIGRPEATLRSQGFNEASAAWLSNPDAALLAADCHWLQGEQLRLLAWGDADYPGLVTTSANAPAVLFVRGAVAALLQPQLAVVGSRHPTAAGRRNAFEFSARLAQAGLTITSGLALGIDAASHEGALRRGQTIAVVGTGLDCVYPRENQVLHDHILAAGGAIVSEFPPGSPPLPQNFPRRNRLMSALSRGTLVVEAARQSGSLITARLAATQGREVYVIPGSIHNPLSHGCHALIRQGAALVESADEILQDLGFNHQKQTVSDSRTAQQTTVAGPLALDKDYEILLDGLGYDPMGIDDLVARTGLSSQSLASMLLNLELAGKVALHSGGRYQRVS